VLKARIYLGVISGLSSFNVFCEDNTICMQQGILSDRSCGHEISQVLNGAKHMVHASMNFHASSNVYQIGNTTAHWAENFGVEVLM
jgi:hypothetical protein